MSERLPINNETAAGVVLRSLDTLFEAALFGTYGDENGELLKDLGIALMHGMTQADPSEEVVKVLNWNTLDSVDITRVPDDPDNPWRRLTFGVKYVLRRRGLLGRGMELPFMVEGEYPTTFTVCAAVTDQGYIYPIYGDVSGDTDDLYVPDPESCQKAQIESMEHWFSVLEMGLLIDMYVEADPLCGIFDEFCPDDFGDVDPV